MSSDPRWRKSSHSSDQGGQCVEVARFTAEEWRKSSHSSDQGGDCVEVARLVAESWRKSAHSDDQGGACVEVAGVGCACEGRARVIAVRDSKDPKGPVLAFGPGEWSGLARRIRAGRLDSR